MLILAIGFVPLAVVIPMRAGSGRRGRAWPRCIARRAAGGLGSAAVFPFEMDTVVALAGGRLVATHYGFYNTVVGVGILVGNLATGALLHTTRDAGADVLLWGALAVIGLVAALALHRLDRTGHLTPKAGQPVSVDR